MLQASEIGTSVGEHQREYLYKMSITTPPKASGEVDNFDVMSQNMDLYNTKGVFPGRKTGDILLKWSGESYHATGVDESTKTGTLTFRSDEKAKIYKFWNQLHELTGNEENHAAHTKEDAKMDISCWQVSVDKETITNAVTLKDVLVLEVGDMSVDKEGTGIATFPVNIAWDKRLMEPDSIGKKV